MQVKKLSKQQIKFFIWKHADPSLSLKVCQRSQWSSNLTCSNGAEFSYIRQRSAFKTISIQVHWCIPIILALKRLRQEDYRSRANLDLSKTLSQNKQKNTQNSKAHYSFLPGWTPGYVTLVACTAAARPVFPVQFKFALEATAFHTASQKHSTDWEARENFLTTQSDWSGELMTKAARLCGNCTFRETRMFRNLLEVAVT